MADQQDAFRYDKMVEKALRGVVKSALEEVIEKGLFDEHHFYITFRTDYQGVQIPDYLRERYPGEMTIVLQHQFYDLEVDTEKFVVMLKFNNVPERLQIPLAAITIFTDPSVNFALQFQPLSEDEAEGGDDYSGEELTELEEGDEDGTGEVISLDRFRKKSDKTESTDEAPATKKKSADKKPVSKEKDSKKNKKSSTKSPKKGSDDKDDGDDQT